VDLRPRRGGGRRVRADRLTARVRADRLTAREREGRPVERATLLREVWGHAWTGGSNVVDVAVSGLRRKLGERAGALQTVRGVGYRLQPL
jgi:Transcriptional regulatory protein, C terminal